jgi:hypothetical protein
MGRQDSSEVRPQVAQVFPGDVFTDRYGGRVTAGARAADETKWVAVEDDPIDVVWVGGGAESEPHDVYAGHPPSQRAKPRGHRWALGFWRILLLPVHVVTETTDRLLHPRG